MKILLLEDDFSLNKVISSYLRSKGFVVSNHFAGDEAIQQLLKAKYDLCILDINVPHINGHNVLEFIQKEEIKVPVIMMSAMKDMQEIKKAYSNGCDDYLKKPFETEELMLRIKYTLKHSLAQDIDIVPLKYGFSFNQNSMTLLQNDVIVDLSTKEKLMLSLFVTNKGQTVTTKMLQDYVWDGEYIEAVSIRTIVHKLKNKLKSGMIINLRGVGYRLLTD